MLGGVRLAKARAACGGIVIRGTARLLLVGAVLALATEVIAAPIRVGTFKGLGPGRFWHTNIHTAGVQIGSILATPDTARIGEDLAIHPDGILYAQFGLLSGTGVPTLDQRLAFLEALDTLDVVVFVSNTMIGDIFPNSLDRARIESFWRRKGVVSVHGTTDSFGGWLAWDSLHGTRFQNHPSSDRYATIRLDTLSGQDDAWHFLNKGLADTTFLEEWFSFTTNASVIRATPGLKTTLNIDEASYTGGMGGARAMGEDHPMSWYRSFPEGGRFFYTALGHRANIYQGGAQPRFLRRQLYNAILWAAGYNNDGTVTGVKQGNQNMQGADALTSRFADHARLSLSGGTLTVSLLHNGAHTVEVLALDGRRIDSRRSVARRDHSFANLQPGVHVVAVLTPEGRIARRVVVP